MRPGCVDMEALPDEALIGISVEALLNEAWFLLVWTLYRMRPGWYWYRGSAKCDLVSVDVETLPHGALFELICMKALPNEAWLTLVCVGIKPLPNGAWSESAWTVEALFEKGLVNLGADTLPDEDLMQTFRVVKSGVRSQGGLLSVDVEVLPDEACVETTIFKKPRWMKIKVSKGQESHYHAITYIISNYNSQCR